MLKQIIHKIREYNHLQPLKEHLVALIGDKKKVKIADIGSGPFSITGQLVPGVEVELHLSDQTDYKYLWDRYVSIASPLFPIEVQNMEAMTYEDDTFDIVHCCNALDHTANARPAILEMKRICKPGGWVYIDCNLIQMSTSGHRHRWDALENGDFVSKNDSFNFQKDYGFDVEFIDNGGERRYNHIIAKFQKPLLS